MLKPIVIDQRLGLSEGVTERVGEGKKTCG